MMFDGLSTFFFIGGGGYSSFSGSWEDQSPSNNAVSSFYETEKSNVAVWAGWAV